MPSRPVEVRYPVILSLAGVVACAPDFDLPRPGFSRALPVRVEPLGSLAAAPSVLRLRLVGAEGRSALADFRFYSGKLGAYHLGRIRRRDLPTTLVEREVPLLTWSEAPDVVVAPLRALDAGTYSLATPELGLVAEVVADPGLVPWVERTWPPGETTAGAGTAIFCGDLAPAVTPGGVMLAPAGIAASVLAGLADSGAFPGCVRVEPVQAAPIGTPLLPPPLAGGAALEPRLLVAERGAPDSPGCIASELAFGPVCGAVADDRVELHAPNGDALVAVEAPREFVGTVLATRSPVLRGFEPASTTRVTGLAFDALGTRVPFDLDVRTTAARPHVVLNEVLSNPQGAETKSEWIELVNDGERPVDLDGFVLDDSIEPVTLPRASLAPDEFALLVAEGFEPDAELDAPPAPGTKLVVLPHLGRSGLANGGELLRLRDRDGNVVSRWPARPSPGSGKSLARRAPDAPDAEAASFAPHAPPGSSPGAPNTVMDE